MQNDFFREDFSGQHCWQYEIREKNLASDLAESKLTYAKITTLKVSDFKLSFVPKEDKESCQKIKDFIIKHEWLGNMPHRPTHRFIATYQGKLAGVVIMATPNTFSHLLGKGGRHLEKLISRGACISWSPKNLASSLIMFSIRWMVKNTTYRLFSAYSDPQAKELGTIYQACNFIYLGQNSGARFKYFDPQESQKGWFSDRIFRKSTSFKKYALQLGINWEKNWGHRDKIYWSEIPPSIAHQLKKASREHQNRCQRQRLPRKHKYIYILGNGQIETKRLRRQFAKLNPEKLHMSYPKDIVPHHEGGLIENRGQKVVGEQRIIPSKRFCSVREIGEIYGISQWVIYHHIKTDPGFPHINVGNKKRFLIDLEKFEHWITRRSQNQHLCPNSNELLQDTPKLCA